MSRPFGSTHEERERRRQTAAKRLEVQLRHPGGVKSGRFRLLDQLQGLLVDLRRGPRARGMEEQACSNGAHDRIHFAIVLSVIMDRRRAVKWQRLKRLFHRAREPQHRTVADDDGVQVPDVSSRGQHDVQVHSLPAVDQAVAAG